jgi:deazaflavin-dependent oxidoreductase (nitroreductase family)
MLTSIERGLVRLAASRAGAWVYVNVFTHIDRLLVRVSHGRLSTAVGTSFHPHIVLLRTVGARTGRSRDVPLLALIDGPRVILIASRGGHARHPAWYHNLRAHPRALVTLQAQTRPYLAREAEGAERTELWRRAVDFYPGYAAYQARVSRRVPVMVLAPAT